MREDTEQVIEREVSEASSLKEASLTQIARSEKEHDQNSWRWIRRFFTEDTSPDNHPIIELQRRATWIGVALILQALNEIPRKYYIPFVPSSKPWSGITPLYTSATLAAFYPGLRCIDINRGHRRARSLSSIKFLHASRIFK